MYIFLFFPFDYLHLDVEIQYVTMVLVDALVWMGCFRLGINF